MESIRKQIEGETVSKKNSIIREREAVSIIAKYLKENSWTVEEQIRV